MIEKKDIACGRFTISVSFTTSIDITKENERCSAAVNNLICSGCLEIVCYSEMYAGGMLVVELRKLSMSSRE